MFVLQPLLFTLLVLFAHTRTSSSSLSFRWPAFCHGRHFSLITKTQQQQTASLLLAFRWASYLGRVVCCCLLFTFFVSASFGVHSTALFMLSPRFFLSCTISHIHVLCTRAPLRGRLTPPATLAQGKGYRRGPHDVVQAPRLENAKRFMVQQRNGGLDMHAKHARGAQ